MSAEREFPDYIVLDIDDPAFKEDITKALNHLWNSPLGRARIEKAHAVRAAQPELTAEGMDKKGYWLLGSWPRLSEMQKNTLLERYNLTRGTITINGNKDLTEYNFFSHQIHISPDITHDGYRGIDKNTHPISLTYALFHEFGHPADELVNLPCLAEIKKRNDRNLQFALLEFGVRNEDNIFMAQEGMALRNIADNGKYGIPRNAPRPVSTEVLAETLTYEKERAQMTENIARVREGFIHETGCLTPPATPRLTRDGVTGRAKTG